MAIAPLDEVECDVVVIGAGVLGIAIASALTRSKMRVTIADGSLPLKGESGHAQGFIHHGGFYLARGEHFTDFAQALAQGAIKWQELLKPASLDLQPVTLVVANNERTSLASRLSECLLRNTDPHITQTPSLDPESLVKAGFAEAMHSQIFQSYTLKDVVIDPVHAARSIVPADEPIPFYHGAIESFQDDGEEVIVVVANPAGVKTRLRASFAVKSTGKQLETGDSRPAPSSTGCTAPETVILVARPLQPSAFRDINVHIMGIPAPPLPLCSPPNLSVASHRDDNAGYWLISSDLLDLSDSHRLAECGLEKMTRSVEDEFCKWFGFDKGELKWGSYNGRLSKPRVNRVVERHVHQSSKCVRAYAERLTLASSLAAQVSALVEDLGFLRKSNEPWKTSNGLSLKEIIYTSSHLGGQTSCETRPSAPGTMSI